jgi:hypothetical protein
MAWLCDETEMKYPNSTSFARKLLLPFLSSYLVECGFRAVNDLLLKKRNCLAITKSGDLILKLTKLVPQIKTLLQQTSSSRTTLTWILFSQVEFDLCFIIYKV